MHRTEIEDAMEVSASTKESTEVVGASIATGGIEVGAPLAARDSSFGEKRGLEEGILQESSSKGEGGIVSDALVARDLNDIMEKDDKVIEYSVATTEITVSSSALVAVEQAGNGGQNASEQTMAVTEIVTEHLDVTRMLSPNISATDLPFNIEPAEHESTVAQDVATGLEGMEVDTEAGGTLHSVESTEIQDVSTGFGIASTKPDCATQEPEPRILRVMDSVDTIPEKESSENTFSTGPDIELVRSRPSPEGTQGVVETNQIMDTGNSTIVMNRFGKTSNGVAEAVAAGVAAGVAEGIAESIAETIVNEAAGGLAKALSEGLTLEGAFARKAGGIEIAKAVAEVIAEGVAHEVAQGLAEGLAEAAEVAQNNTGVEEIDVAMEQARNVDGVLCECGNIPVVRVAGEKSPNRGLQYLMCASQEPSFFKRKGKKRVSNTDKKCRFFKWVDPPRYTKDAKKKEEKEKLLQQEVQSTTYSTRSAVKKGNPQLGSPRAALPMSLEVAETPAELPSSKAADVSEGQAEAFEGEFEENRRQDRQRRGKAPAGTDEKDTLFLTDQTSPTGTLAHFTRGSAKKDQLPSLSSSMAAGAEGLVEPEDRQADPVAADGQAVGLLSGKVDSGALARSLEDQNGKKANNTGKSQVEKKEKGQRISSSKAIQLDHKSRISVGGLAGDSSSSGARVEGQVSHHATRSSLRKGSTVVKESLNASRHLDGQVLEELGVVEDLSKSTPVNKEESHFTRSASKKGTPEVVEEQNIVISPTSTPASVLGKRTGDWTDSYPGPEYEQERHVRKRRSQRADTGPSRRFSLGGTTSERTTVFGSPEKRTRHYSRRSTGILGASTRELDRKSMISPQSLAAVTTSSVGRDDEKESQLKRGKSKVKLSTGENKSKNLSGGFSERVPLGASSKKARASEAVENTPTVEFEKKKQSQPRRQQRKLPLSEVYGTVELLPAVTLTSKGATSVDRDQSPSPSHGTSGMMASPVTEQKEAGTPSKSGSKKRKASGGSGIEDNVAPENNRSKRSGAKKGKTSVDKNSVGRQNPRFSLVNAPLVSFPAIRYAAIMAKDEQLDPDDPWSLDGPWAKKEDKLKEKEDEKENMLGEESGENEKEKEHCFEEKTKEDDKEKEAEKEGTLEEKAKDNNKEKEDKREGTSEVEEKETEKEKEGSVEEKANENDEEKEGSVEEKANENDEEKEDEKEDILEEKLKENEKEREGSFEERVKENVEKEDEKEGTCEEKVKENEKEKETSLEFEVNGNENEKEGSLEEKAKESEEEKVGSLEEKAKEYDVEKEHEIEGTRAGKARENDKEEGDEKEGTFAERPQEDEKGLLEEKEKDHEKEKEDAKEGKKEEDEKVEEGEKDEVCGQILDRIETPVSLESQDCDESTITSRREYDSALETLQETPLEGAEKDSNVCNFHKDLDLATIGDGDLVVSASLTDDDVVIPTPGEKLIMSATPDERDVPTGGNSDLVASENEKEVLAKESPSSLLVLAAGQDSEMPDPCNEEDNLLVGRNCDLAIAEMEVISEKTLVSLPLVAAEEASRVPNALKEQGVSSGEKVEPAVTAGVIESLPASPLEYVASLPAGEDSREPGSHSKQIVITELKEDRLSSQTQNLEGSLDSLSQSAAKTDHVTPDSSERQELLTKGDCDVVSAVKGERIFGKALEDLSSLTSGESLRVPESLTEENVLVRDNNDYVAPEAHIKDPAENPLEPLSLPAVGEGAAILGSGKEDDVPILDNLEASALKTKESIELSVDSQSVASFSEGNPKVPASVKEQAAIATSLVSAATLSRDLPKPADESPVRISETLEMWVAETGTQAGAIVEGSRSTGAGLPSTTDGPVVVSADDATTSEKIGFSETVSDYPLKGDVEVTEGVDVPTHADHKAEAMKGDSNIVHEFQEPPYPKSTLFSDSVNEPSPTTIENQIESGTDFCTADGSQLPTSASQAVVGPYLRIGQRGHENVVSEVSEVEEYPVKEDVDMVEVMDEEPAVSGNIGPAISAVKSTPMQTGSQVDTGAGEMPLPSSTSQPVVEKRKVGRPRTVHAHASGDTPDKAGSARAPAASENTGFVDSVWRLASGRKTRSVGSIGAPAVTSKRSRSVISAQKGGRPGEHRGGFRHQMEAQWVDVPLDWRNEKSGRLHLLTNARNRNTIHSAAAQSGLQVNNPGGAHEAHLRGTGGEVDEASIVTEEKGKVLDFSVMDSKALPVQEPSLFASNGEGTSSRGAVNGAVSAEGVLLSASRVLDTGEQTRETHTAWTFKQHTGESNSGKLSRDAVGGKTAVDVGAALVAEKVSNPDARDEATYARDEENVVEVQKRKRGRPRKVDKKRAEKRNFAPAVVSKSFADRSLPEGTPQLQSEVGASEGEVAMTMQAEPAENANADPRPIEIGNSAEGGKAPTELHENVTGIQLERSASNTEGENGQEEEKMTEHQEGKCRAQEGGTLIASAGVNLEAPFCACKLVHRPAVIKTIVRNGDPNQGLRYWGCSNYKLPFTKRKETLEYTDESCKYFRWLDTPRVTAFEKKERRRERYRQVELQRLL